MKTLQIDTKDIGSATFTVREKSFDSNIAQEIWHDRYYVEGGFDIPFGAVVLDIGAHIGLFAVFAANCGASKVYAYEPMPMNYDLLVKNIAANKMTGIVLPFNEAVTVDSGRFKMTEFYKSRRGLYHTGESKIKEEGTVPVRGIGLRKVLDKAPHFDVVKLDIEGYEYDLLYYADEEMYRKIDMILMEFHSDNAKNCEAKGQELGRHLTARGFHVKTNWSYGNQGRLQAKRI